MSENPNRGQRLINIKEIQIGSGSTVFKVNKEGLFMGADNFTDAPFKVTFAGAITATGLTVGDGTITTAKLADGAVTTIKIANANITTAKIADANITTGKIADAQITTAKIADAQITNAKINDLSADKINAGTLVGRTVESNSDGYRIILDASNRRIGIQDGTTLKGSIFCDSDGDLKIYSQDDMVFNVPTGYQYRFRTNDALQQFLDADGDWNPRANNTQKVGTLGYAYSQMNSYDFNDHCLWLDEEDDLEILKKCAPKKDKKGEIIRNKDGKPELDPKSLPEWMNTEKNLREEVKIKGLELTEEEITDRIGRNLGHFVDLIAGSVRKLADKIDELDNKIKLLERKK